MKRFLITTLMLVFISGALIEKIYALTFSGQAPQYPVDPAPGYRLQLITLFRMRLM